MRISFKYFLLSVILILTMFVNTLSSIENNCRDRLTIEHFIKTYVGDILDEGCKVYLIPSPICPGCAIQATTNVIEKIISDNSTSRIITNNVEAQKILSQYPNINYIIDDTNKIDFLPISYKVYSQVTFAGGAISEILNLTELE